VVIVTIGGRPCADSSPASVGPAARLACATKRRSRTTHLHVEGPRQCPREFGARGEEKHIGAGPSPDVHIAAPLQVSRAHVDEHHKALSLVHCVHPADFSQPQVFPPRGALILDSAVTFAGFFDQANAMAVGLRRCQSRAMVKDRAGK
jgi:hypothetical protein